MAKKNAKCGQILLAEPFMVDPNFRRSVVLLCEHEKEGSLGFILNKILDIKINELITDFPEFEANIYYGGPVQTDTIHYVHNVHNLLKDSQKVSKGVFWGGDFEKLKFLVDSNMITPDNIRFFVGYSGWSEDQLKEEIGIGSWVPAEMDSKYLFKSKHTNLWEKVMKKKGDIFSVISQVPESGNWN